MEETADNKTIIQIIKEKLKQSRNIDILKECCCFRCCSSCRKQIKDCFSKIPIVVQFIIFIVPILLIFAVLITFTHIILISDILKFDYFTIIKEEFLRYFLTDLDDINFDLNKKKVSSSSEDISNLLFFKVYFEELNSYGLLNNDTEKIFPNISNLDENIYESLEKYNSIFSIPKNMSEKYIDSRNDSFSELAKIYFHFYPLIAAESNKAKTFINQTYLISYEADKSSNEIQGDILYFNYPRIADSFMDNSINFYPLNNLISPRIEDIDYCNKNDNYNSYEENERLNKIFRENWFIYFDCQFRTQRNFDYYMNFFHLNENDRGNINKTNIITLQTNLYTKENKKIIINIVFFMEQKKLRLHPFDDSAFLVFNFTYNNRKYSDDQTFVLNNGDITEISLSDQLEQYFHYGLSAKDDNFFSQGIYYDNIDINKFNEPSKNYSATKGFNCDMRYFTSFYLFAKLFETSDYTKEYIENYHIYYYIFNSSKQIKDICSTFDFGLYRDSLNTNEIDCFNQKNLLYYSRDNINKNSSEKLTLPLCICLPLYCIKNLKQDFSLENIEFVDELYLPEKCENKLLYFQNSVDEYNEDNVVNQDISNIQLRLGENLEEQLESQIFKFSNEKKELNGGLNIVMISIISNDAMKRIIVEFVENFNKITVIFLIIIVCGTIIIFTLMTVLLILFILSISKVINDYVEKVYSFFRKTSNIKNIKEEDKNSDENILIGDRNNFEKLSLLIDENPEDKDDKENEMIEDLYKIYFKFYKLSEDNLYEILGKKQRKQNLEKINKIKNSNELFKIFVEFSIYIQKFKFDINFDYDFFKESKLIKNFEKIFSKKLICKEDTEQILYTKSIIRELLSTEMVDDYGFITNLNFNYMTNINLNNKQNKNYIQIAILKNVEKTMKSKKYKDDDYIENNGIEGFNNNEIKIVFKNKNIIMKIIEEKFEQDDYLNIKKLESSFNNTLVNSCYNYMKKIIIDEINA